MEDFDPMHPLEWRIIYGAVVGLVLLGLATWAVGLFNFKQGVALGVGLSLLSLLFHMSWRYRPLNRAAHLLDVGEFAEAESLLRDYLASTFHRGGRAGIKAHILLAQSLWYQGETEKALEEVEALQGKVGSDHLLDVLLKTLEVACYVQMRKPLKVHEAMGALLKTDGLTPAERWESQIFAGICAMNEELFHDAIEFFEAAERSCEDDDRKAYIYGMLSACYNRVKDYMRALGAVQDGKKLESPQPLTQALLLDNFAFAKANLRQDLEEALAAVEEGIALGVPAAMPHLHTSLGEVHYALRDFDKAMAALEEAIRALPERDKNARQKAWFIKGKIHKARGEDELAMEALSEAISIDSSKTIAMNAQAVLASPEGLNTLIQTGDVKLSPG